MKAILLRLAPKFSEVLGYDEEDLISQPMTDFIHPDDFKKTDKEIQRINSGEETIQFINRYKCKKGNYKNLMWTAKLDPESGLRYVAARDITELIKAQEKSQQYFDILNNSLNEMYIICAETLHIIDANIGAQNNIGFTEIELDQCLIFDLNPELTPVIFQKIIAPLTDEKEAVVTFETTYKRKDGSSYMAFVNLQLTKLGDKSVFIALAIDISDRILQEVELKDTKDRLGNIVDYANVGIAYAKEDGFVIAANLKFAKILEYDSGDDIIGMKVKDFTFSEDLRLSSNLSKEIKEGKRDTFEIEKRYVTKNGKIIWVDLNVSAVRNKFGELVNYIAMVIDVTEKKEKEEIIKVLTLYHQRMEGKLTLMSYLIIKQSIKSEICNYWIV